MFFSNSFFYFYAHVYIIIFRLLYNYSLGLPMVAGILNEARVKHLPILDANFRNVSFRVESFVF